MKGLELRAFITDELVQKEGYPNSEVYWLEADLILLAEQWRISHADKLVKEYHKLFLRLLGMGWTVDLLGVNGLLPSKFMPVGYQNLS
jgi:hypothetical protein